MAIVFRTAGAWGAGKGSNLTPAEVDGNFYDLDQRVETLETNSVAPITIVSMALNGTAFTIGLSDGSTLGPITFPLLAPQWRGPWAPATAYQVLNFFTAPDGSVGTVIIDHTSAASFDWAADDGMGNLIYQQLSGGRPPQSVTTTFTTPGAFSWTVPSGVFLVRRLTAFGGGGAGGWGDDSGGTASGGSAGATGVATNIAVSPGDVIDGVVGAGGAGNSSGDGDDGVDTTITIGATTYTAPGGPGGLSSGTSAADSPSPSDVPVNFDSVSSYRGGQGLFGFTAVGGVESGNGGAATLGGPGGVGGGGLANSGMAPGGGGGGSGNDAGPGGDGAEGAVYIEY